MFMSATPRSTLFLSTVSLLGMMGLANTAGANPLNDTHIFRAGVYEQDIDISAAITRDPYPEQDIDFDKVLGVDDSTTSFFFQYQWRFREKWDLSIFYTQMEADGKKRATRDFNWDGQDYTAGVQLSTELTLDTYLASVDYSFIRDDRKEFGMGFGLHAFDIGSTIELRAGIDQPGSGEDVSGKAVRTSSDLLAPLPNLRAYGRFMVTPKWAVIGSMGWLSANYEDYDGDYLFITLLTEYRFTERFGVGFSYQVSEIDITHDTKRGSKHFDIDQYGPSIYLTYGF